MRNMFKRGLLLLLVCALLIFWLAGCGVLTDYSGISIGNKDEISELIRGAMQRRSYRVTISYDAWTFDREKTEEAVAELVENALYESGDPAGGDYLRFQYGGYRLTHSVEKGLLKYKYKAGIVPEYYTTSEQEAEVDEEIAKVIEGFALSPEASDLEKIRCVHDFISGCTSYDKVHKHQGSSHIQSTAYGALVYRTALCQGYAVLAYRLLKELGVENRIVTGKAVVENKTERHAWNIVRAGDVFYNLDVTLDDANDSDAWFLKSDASFRTDHTRDEKYSSDSFYEQYPMSEEDYLN